MSLIDILDNRSLTASINAVKTIESFAIDKIFKSKQIHTSDKIDVEIYSNADKLAQFVGRSDKALPIKKSSKVTQTVSLPRTFEKKIFDATELADYKSLGTMYAANPQDRVAMANEWIKREVQDLKNRIIRRREQMAIEALSTGGLTVAQDNVTFTVSFGFQATKQLITLGAGKKWSDSGVKMLANLRAWKSQMMKQGGYNSNIVLMGSEAADAFIQDAEVMKALDAANNRIGALDLNGKYTPSGLYLGTILGLDIYEYNQQYTNQSGTPTDMLDPKKVVVVSTDAPFRTHIGPIYRVLNGASVAHNVEFLLESTENNDNTELEWKAEQKSLPTIHDPNGVISVTVL